MANINVELNSKPFRTTSEYTLLSRITVDHKHSRIRMNYITQKRHLNSSTKSMGFFEYADNVSNSLKADNHYYNDKKYNTVILKLTDFKNNADIQFYEPTQSLLDSFEAYLVKNGM